MTGCYTVHTPAQDLTEGEDDMGVRAGSIRSDGETASCQFWRGDKPPEGKPQLSVVCVLALRGKWKFEGIMLDASMLMWTRPTPH